MLLDEDVPLRLRHHWPEWAEVETAEYRGWKGLKNGELLQAAQSDFDALVTLDNKLPDQQNLTQYDLAVIVLRPRSKRLPDLLELMPEVERRLGDVPKGTAIRIAARSSS